MEDTSGILIAEDLKGLVLRSCSEGKEGEVVMLAMGNHLLHEFILRVDLLLALPFKFCILTECRLGVRESRLELLCGRTGL